MQVLEASFEQPVSEQEVRYQLDGSFKIDLFGRTELIHCFLVEIFAELADTIRND